MSYSFKFFYFFYKETYKNIISQNHIEVVNQIKNSFEKLVIQLQEREEELLLKANKWKLRQLRYLDWIMVYRLENNSYTYILKFYFKGIRKSNKFTEHFEQNK
jgi:predicted nucleic acid-binding protein